MPVLPGGTQLSIAGGVREFVKSTPSAIAVIDGDKQLTYAQLGDRAARTASTLLSLGLSTGERVAVLLGNRLEYPEIACGIAMAGLVMVPLNPRMTESEAEYILGHSGARALILDDAFSNMATLGVRTHELQVLSIEGSTLGPSYEAAIAASPAVDPQVQTKETDPYCIAYTSGTTGRPKGVVISHRSRSLTFYFAAFEWNLATGRRSIAVAPMYHGAGFAFGYAPVYTGGTVVMLNRWNPKDLLALIEKHRAQSVFLVPTHAQMLRELGPEVLAKYDLSSLDTLFFNASALPWPLKEWVMETFPNVGVHELYGSTEGGIVTNLRPVDMHRKPGSVGHPWFQTEVRILNEDGDPVQPGEIGELFSRSPFLMNGYHNDHKATEECTTVDGFLTCGDLVVVDEEGYITIVDRKNDKIISGGVNIFPREIEEVLETYHDVAEVAVVGLPSSQWGEEIAAFVVLRSGSSVTIDALEEHCRSSLAGYKVPRRWEFVESLPRNAAGKVLKRDLRQNYK